MSLRDEMPGTAAAIDDLRAAFGADVVDTAIRKGMNGEAGFFAQEANGKTFGTAMPAAKGELDAEQYLKLGRVKDAAVEAEERKAAARARRK